MGRFLPSIVLAAVVTLALFAPPGWAHPAQFHEQAPAAGHDRGGGGGSALLAAGVLVSLLALAGSAYALRYARGAGEGE